MTLIKEVGYLLSKEFHLEWRRKYALSGILLYVLSTVFIIYTIIGEKAGAVVWAALFWIIVLFASVNAVAKSFSQENQDRQLYYYTLCSPTSIVIAKITYNSVLLFFISILSYLFFGLIMDNPIKFQALYFLILFLGAISFSISMTFISSISSKANQNATLMAILSFPILIPIIMTLLRLTKIALGLMVDTEYYKDIFILLSLDLILISLVMILFPFLWKD